MVKSTFENARHSEADMPAGGSTPPNAFNSTKEEGCRETPQSRRESDVTVFYYECLKSVWAQEARKRQKGMYGGRPPPRWGYPPPQNTFPVVPGYGDGITPPRPPYRHSYNNSTQSGSHCRSPPHRFPSSGPVRDRDGHFQSNDLTRQVREPSGPRCFLSCSRRERD